MTDVRKVGTWHATLRALAVLNILLWSVTCLPLGTGDTLLGWQVLLSGIYVVVCAFRSWLPRIDLERYCLVDSPLSSMFLGRAAATVAEVCFAAQIALFLNHVGTVAGIEWIVTVSYLVVPPLALAQLFCWYSVLSLNHLGHAIEESLWTATMAVVGVSLVAASSHLDGTLFAVAVAGAVFAAGFVAFMVTVDVPMYLQRWRESRQRGGRYLTLRDGLRDALFRRVATRDWRTWRPEVAWLTGYFSVAVWLSLALVHLSTP
ncbi:MAG: hypothetical protein B7733_15390 [Myxococcales bacterium FL481]|nr:MAG: hypothetical protein B7733_15390 [Myxococcales bacterium FL481]